MEAPCKTETSRKKTSTFELPSVAQVEMGSLKLSGYCWTFVHDRDHAKCQILDNPSGKTLTKLCIIELLLNNDRSSQDYLCSPVSYVSKRQSNKVFLFYKLKYIGYWMKTSVFSKWNVGINFLLSYLSASREHQLPGVLGRRQVPQSGSLPGLVCVVCIFSHLSCRAAAGQLGNHIYSNDQNGWEYLSAWHCWWYGWVVHLWSTTVLLFSLCLSSLTCIEPV